MVNRPGLRCLCGSGEGGGCPAACDRQPPPSVPTRSGGACEADTVPLHGVNRQGHLHPWSTTLGKLTENRMPPAPRAG